MVDVDEEILLQGDIDVNPKKRMAERADSEIGSDIAPADTTSDDPPPLSNSPLSPEQMAWTSSSSKNFDGRNHTETE